jgi:hypothetical protein
MEATLGISELLELLQIVLAISALSLASAIFFLNRVMEAEGPRTLMVTVCAICFLLCLGAVALSATAGLRSYVDLLGQLELKGCSLFLSPYSWIGFAWLLLFLAISLLVAALIREAIKAGWK